MAKANRKFRYDGNGLHSDRKGVVGIGTLIIFIALILVAAIAAAIVIQTAQLFAEDAEQRGNAAQNEISGGVKILDIVGDRGPAAGVGPTPCSLAAPQGNIRCIAITTTTWDSSDAIDFADLRIHWVGPTRNTFLTLNPAAPNPMPCASGVNYCADEVPTGTPGNGWNIATATYFLDDDNIVQIWIDLTAAGINDPLPQTSSVTIRFLPAHGPATTETFITPGSYTGEFIDLTNS